MAYFAKLNSENVVEQVISINNSVITDANGIEQEQLGIDFINNMYKTNDVWKKTSYNTRGGLYYNQNINNKFVLSEDQSKSFRKNYAGKGHIYDENRDAFIPPKPYNSWILNESTCLWEAPIAKPDNKLYIWNEESLSWERMIL
jgi:hypothetical protein